MRDQWSKYRFAVEFRDARRNLALGVRAAASEMVPIHRKGALQRVLNPGLEFPTLIDRPRGQAIEGVEEVAGRQTARREEVYGTKDDGWLSESGRAAAALLILAVEGKFSPEASYWSGDAFADILRAYERSAL